MPPSTGAGADAATPSRHGIYKRAYKACETCRRTKSKCELQPAISDSACVRCCRERRPCVFPLQRSNKRAKTASSDHGHVNSNHDASNGQVHRQASGNGNSRPISVVESDPSTARRGDDPDPVIDQAAASTHTLPGAVRQSPRTGDLSENLAKTLVTSSKDAIGLLFQAAVQNDADSKSDDGDATDFLSASRDDRSDAASPLMHSEAQLPPQLSRETVALWNKHRFVVQGWFSALEAISYLQFFLDRFAPLSPVADFFYADHDTHKRLILDEPLLCCTILMISSRHLAAHGRAGKTRSAFIHARLWRHIEHLVLRITFGTEKYSSAKSRTLGSIQALLLIIEWHPRLLHFPPEHDGWDAGLAATVDDTFEPQDRSSEAARRWREDVFEPAKRSDRLSWTLVGLAITLAHELGVFDPQLDDSGSSPAEISTRATKMRIKKLLFLYSQQLSLRLGCPNMFPQGDHSALQPATTIPPSPIDQVASEREVLLTKWIEITKLLTTATHMFFSSKSAIKNVLRSGQYVGLLEHFQPLLIRWHEDFSRTSLTTIPPAARQALLVEYHYTRMYINSIALQALVERASQASSGDTWLEQDYLRKESAQDLGFINEVKESSGQILVITKTLSDAGVLPFLPVRFFLRVVAASIFLLKTICLRAKGHDARVALDQLDDAVQALMASDADDIHLSSRYAELIGRHVRRMKRKLQAERAGRAPVARNAAASAPRAATAFTPQMDPVRDDAPEPTASDVSNDFGTIPNPAPAAPSGIHAEQASAVEADAWLGGFWDDWLAQPLDPLVAPFGIEPAQSTAGLTSDSLDFLWASRL